MDLMRVTAVDYVVRNDEPIVQLAGRDENDERRTFMVAGAEPYIFVKESELWDSEVHECDEFVGIEYGYESYDGFPLAKLYVRVPSNAGDKGQGKNLTKLFEETWESDIPFYRRVSIDYGLSGYIRVPESGEEIHIDDIETGVDETSVTPINPRLFIADIEVINPDRVSYDKLTDDYSGPITHITGWDSLEDEYVCLYIDREGHVEGSRIKSLLETASSDVEGFDELDRDITLRRYETEQGLLNGFVREIRDRQPDVVSGWNFVSFDWDYILGRIRKMDGVYASNLSDIGRVSGYVTERKVDCLPAFDMLRGYKKMTVPVQGRMRSYSLDYVSKEEIGMGKLPDVSVTDEYENDRSRVTAYNILDVMLCVAIERKQRLHEFFFEIAEFCQIQLYDTVSEMREVDGYIMSRSEDDEILPTADESEVPENAGGLVLMPSDGVADWVSVFDLKSLYPSCMITWNLSPETIYWYDEEDPSHDNIINVPWLPDADHAEGGDFGVDDIEFGKMWADLSEEGLIPKYLRRLFPEREKRKRIRDEHKPGTPEYEMWDRRQAAVKVIMNAFYGVCSMDYWRLATDGLGDSITSSARYALWAGKDIIEEQGKSVKYGDSVPGFETVYVSDGVVNTVKPIEELYSEYDPDSNLKVWSENGWTELNDVIQKPNRKTLYRIRTKSGVVHVTEDHSLVLKDGTEISPKEVEEGQKLLHSAQDYGNFNKSGLPDKSGYRSTHDKAWLYGVFVADGSSGTYEGDSGVKYQWKISKDDERLLEECSYVLEGEWGIDSTIYSDDEYTSRIVPNRVRGISEEFRSACYDSNGKKKIPDFVLNGNRSVVLSFLDGYRRGDGEDSERDKKLFKRSYTNSATLASGLGVLARKAGMELGVDVRDNHEKEYYRVWMRNWSRGDENLIESIEEFEYDGDYVYDLSTDDEHFNSGIGTITVHNTDSVFTEIEEGETKQDKLEISQAVEYELNERIGDYVVECGIDEHPYLGEDIHGDERHALVYEFEKLYRRFFQPGRKKRYAGNIVWKEGKHIDGEIDITGFESKRSDSPEITSEVQPEVINRILEGQEFEEISDYVTEIVEGIREGTMEPYRYALPKSLGQSLDDYADIPAARACRFSNKHLGKEWAESDDPWMYYIESSPPMEPQTDVIALGWGEELPGGYELDVEKTIERALENPLSDVFEEVGWSFTEIKTGNQMAESSDFGDWSDYEQEEKNSSSLGDFGW